MKLTLLLMLLAGPAFAGGGSFFNGGGGDGSSSSTGTHTDGGNASFKNVTAETLTSTGTAPSLTATGANVNGQAKVSSAPLILDGAGGGLIYGDATAYPRLSLLNASGAQLFYNASNFIEVANGLLRFAPGSGPYMYATANGWGIGTVAPSSPLHVSSGPIKVVGTGAQYQGDSTTGFLKMDDVTGTQLKFGASPTGYNIQNGAIIVKAREATVGEWSDTTSNGGVKGTLCVGLSCTGTTSGVNFSNLGDSRFDGAITAKSSITVTGSNNMSVGGNLGIGTASPNAKLDVTGAAMFGTGGTQSTFTATGFFQPYSRTTLQLSLLAPSAVGQYIDNSTLGALCRSTGTSAGNWALATAAGTGCF